MGVEKEGNGDDGGNGGDEGADALAASCRVGGDGVMEGVEH